MGTLLVALSHPDDEIGCLGTMALHRTLGHRVVLLFLTRGEMTESLGPLSADEIGRVRVGHANHIAGLLGCEVRFLDFKDTMVHANPESTYVVAREIADIRPDAVITWGDAWIRGMRHPDHRETGLIVRDAITVARMKRAVVPLEPHRGAAALFTIRDRHSTLPCAAIDVSAQVEPIIKVANFYQSQLGWPEEAWLRDRLAQAGARWGVRHAEEFDAWESVAGLRATLLGDHLPV